MSERVKMKTFSSSTSLTDTKSTKLNEIMNQPGVELIISASLALNASRTRRKRIFLFHRRRRQGNVTYSEHILRLLFIFAITAALVLSSITVITFSQALIDSNFECIISPELKIRKDSVGIEVDQSKKHLSTCLFCFR